jgi:hypothetical protein
VCALLAIAMVQVEARFANMPPSLVGMEACVVRIISVGGSKRLGTMRD